MAQPSMTVRIAANIQELRRNMAEGRDQIEATRAGFQKLATSFQGDKIIQHANNAAAAVQSIGGASKLTEAEQARVNKTVEAALAKYAALGKEAPSALRELAEQTAKAEQKTSFLSTAAGKLVALFSAAAIGRAAKDVADYAGKLNDLKDITGESVVKLQVLERVAADGGAGLDELARGAVVLSKNLIGENKGAVDAVRSLGLSVSDLVASGPADAFITIGDAIAQVPDPMQRAALATEIFGKAGADFLPVFAGDMRGVADAALASGTILSEKLVNDVDNAGKAMERLSFAGTSLIANVLGPLAPGIEVIANWLGQALTTSLNVARGGVDALVIKGMEMEIWLREMALSIAETVKAVPGLGSVFGKTSEDIEGMRRSVQESKDALKMYTTEAVTPATAAVTAAAPVTRTYGEALTHVATSAQQATVAVGAMQGPSATMLNLESRTLQETVKLNAELVRWANTNGAVLAPSIRQVNGALGEQAPLISSMTTQWTGFAGSVQQNTAAAGASTGGFMDRIKGLFGGGGGAGGGGGMMSNLLGNIGPQFAAAFLGPGSAADKMKSFATAAAGTLMGMIPGVGPFLQQFSGPIIEGLTKLAGKAKELLSGIFGGPSATEREQRTLVKTFEEDLASALTEQQKLEAGGESWKATVIRIRDAYIAQGRSAAEAEADAKRLWESSKKGAGATAEVIADIKRKMDQAADAGVNFATRVGAAIDGIPRDVDVDVNFRRNGDEDYGEAPGFKVGSRGIRDFGAGTLAVLHGRERVQTEAQMEAEHKALTQTSGTIVDGGGSEIASEIRRMVDDLKMTLPLAMRDAMAGAR